MISFSLLNSPNNGYNRSMGDALISQKMRTKVWGKNDWKPVDKYSDLPKSVYNRYLTLSRAPAINPAQKLMQIRARQFVRKHTFPGTYNYGNADNFPRRPVNPTSTAFELIKYDLDSNNMQYKFRNNDRMYLRPVDKNTMDIFMTSGSIGRTFHNLLK